MVKTRSCTRRVNEEAEVCGDQQLWPLFPYHSPNTVSFANNCSLSPSRRSPLGYMTQVPHSGHESGAATFTAMNGTQNAKLADNLQNVDMELCEEVDYIQSVYPSIAQLEATDKESIKKSVIVSDSTTDKAQSLVQADSNATSLNLSDMLMLDDEFSSVDSKQIDVLVTVAGYRVKEEVAPTLRSIISKYGDIAANCKKSLEFRSFLLENVCSIVKKLEVTEFICLKTVEIDSFRVFLKDIESVVNVRWLLQRLDGIKEAKRLLRESPKVKQAKRQNQHAVELKESEIKAYEKEIRILQQKIKSAKHEIKSRSEEKKKFDKILSLTKAQLKPYHCRSMTHGLV